jgi:hypothetical protein
MCIPQLEFMASLGFDVSWGGTATGAQVGSPNMYSLVLDVGLGVGALPTGMNYLRPFAITGELSTTTPGQAVRNDDQFATSFNWGFTLQYSVPTSIRTSARLAMTSLGISFRPSNSLSPRPPPMRPRGPGERPVPSNPASSIWPTNGNSRLKP